MVIMRIIIIIIIIQGGEASSPSPLVVQLTLLGTTLPVTRLNTGIVTIDNLAVYTTLLTNGILCQMHLTEGCWLFRGASGGTGV